MAAPTWQATGTFQNGAAVQLTVPWPAHQADDIALLFVQSNSDIGLLTTNGFAQVPDSPQSGTGCTLSVWWCRATSGAMASPVTNTGVNNCSAVIVTIRGAITSGNPWEVTSGSATAVVTTVSIPGDTTTLSDQLVVFADGRGSDVAGAVFSGEAATNVASLAERVDDGTATGNGGGIGVWTGTRLVAGAYGPLTCTALGVAAGQGLWSASIKPASSAVTGTVAVTQAADVAAFTGTVLNPITGTIAATQAAQTMAATGAEGMTGTIAATQAAQTMAASGSESMTGTVAATQANQTGAFTGSEGMSGTVAATQADQVGAFTGTVTSPAVTGTVAATQDPNVGVFTGSETISGTVAATQAPQVGALTGTVANPVTGTVAATQADQTGVFNGTVVSDGTLNSIQQDQTGSFTGTVAAPVTGTITVTQADQTGAFTGTNTPPAITGTVGAVQQDQTGSFTGSALMGVVGTINVTQDGQTMTAGGTVSAVAVTGTIGAVQANQTATFVGTAVSPILTPPGTVICELTAATASCVLTAPVAVCVLTVATAACSISPVNVIAGTNVEITSTFRKANGDLADPTTVTALIRHPDGTTSGPTPTSSSTGIWTTVVPTDDPGYWYYQISGSGNETDVVCVGSFCAQPSLVLV